MAAMTLPPGFRFHPTDNELVGYYLKRRVDNLKIDLEVIPVIDLYKCEPWELPGKSFLPNKDLEWFFFVPRDRKYPNGSRTNRATFTGYWKATGKDRKVSCDGGVYAVRKTLVFYKGRAPGGERTDWVMHEYRLCQDLHHGASNFIGAYALCRVTKRHEAGLHGEPASSASATKANGTGSGLEMSKVLSNSSLVTTDHQLSSLSNASFTPSPPHLDITSSTFQGPYAGGDVMRDMTPLSLPPLCTPQDATFFLGDDFAGAGSEQHQQMPSFLGDMGGNISEHDFRWDDIYANTFSTTAAGAEHWNSLPNNAPLLCRQASDGVDDLAAWYPSVDENIKLVF